MLWVLLTRCWALEWRSPCIRCFVHETLHSQLTQIQFSRVTSLIVFILMKADANEKFLVFLYCIWLDKMNVLLYMQPMNVKRNVRVNIRWYLVHRIDMICLLVLGTAMYCVLALIISPENIFDSINVLFSEKRRKKKEKERERGGKNSNANLQIWSIDLTQQWIRWRIHELDVADIPSFAAWCLLEHHEQCEALKFHGQAADILVGAIARHVHIVGHKCVGSHIFVASRSICYIQNAIRTYQDASGAFRIVESIDGCRWWHTCLNNRHPCHNISGMFIVCSCSECSTMTR